MFRWRQFQRPFRELPRQFQNRSYRIPGGRPQYQRFKANRSNLIYRWAASPTFYRDIGIISAGGGCFYLYNSETVPVSGRRRFNMISPSVEAWFSQGTQEEIMNQYRGQILPDWDPRVRRVKRVLERLLPYVKGHGLEEVDWEVHVIESPEQNAFVIPGGKVFVFTGILPLCKGEDGIAAVLAHEIAHVVAHHPAERMSRAPLILIAALAVSMFDVSFYSAKMLFDLFFSLPGSRKQEAEADYIGLLMMAQGCYRPEAAAEFWARMDKVGAQGAPPQVLSTHPSNHNRQEKIIEWLPKAHEKAEASDCGLTSGYADQFAAAFGQSPRGGW